MEISIAKFIHYWRVAKMLLVGFIGKGHSLSRWSNNSYSGDLKKILHRNCLFPSFFFSFTLPSYRKRKIAIFYALKTLRSMQCKNPIKEYLIFFSFVRVIIFRTNFLGAATLLSNIITLGTMHGVIYGQNKFLAAATSVMWKSFQAFTFLLKRLQFISSLNSQNL